MIRYKNNPKLSEHEVDRKFNDRRLNLLPQIEQLIETSEIFQGQEVSVEFAHTGVSSLVCFVEAGGTKYVLKVPLSLTDGGGSESQFLAAWESAGVKVPHVFDSGTLGEHAYTVMEYVDAPLLQATLKDGSSPESSWREMGMTLATMHAPETKGFGRVIEGEPEYATFREWLLGPSIAKRVKNVQELGLLGDEHGSIEKVFDTLLAYAEGKDTSTYCHFDFTPNNILATDPLTVFDPSPMLNHGIIDIGRSMLSTLFKEKFEAAELLKDGYFASGTEYDSGALHASVILNAYWKLPYVSKKGRGEDIERVQAYLAQNRRLIY